MSKNDPTSAPLAELVAAAKQLNQATNQVNLEILSVEKALAVANVGLTFWFEETPIDESDASGDLGPHDTRQHNAEVMGYARVDGKWKLAVKRVRYVSGFYEGDISSPYTNVFADGDPTALLKASRDLRLSAIRLMPKFLESFKEKVKKHVFEIEVTTGKVFY